MAHEVFRLASRKIFNKPHLIENDALTNILDYIDKRPSLAVTPKGENATRRLMIEDRVAYLSVSGPLTYESTGLEALCGMTSYQGLVAQAKAAVKEGINTMVLDINSPGGEAYGVFETAQEIRALADQNGVKLISYVDGLSASAGYALASTSHEIVSNPSSQVGSIGVVVRLMNTNGYEKEKGIQTSYVYAGKSKIPYDEEGNFSEDYISDLQAKVDTLYEEFTSFIADNRNMSVEDVVNTEARTFLAKDALNLGLVDSLLTRGEFYTKLAQEKEGNQNMPLQMNDTGEKTEMSNEKTVKPENSAQDVSAEDLTDIKAQLADLTAKLEASEKEKEQLLENATNAKLEELADKAKAWDFAGVDPEAYAKAALDGFVPVGMLDEAMENASSKLEEKDAAFTKLQEEVEAFREVGVATPEVETTQEIDEVESVLQSQGKIKNK